MSEELRNKHARRIGQKERHINRQLKIAEAHGMDTSEPHRYAKMNALNCGIPNCPMCSNPRHSGYVKQTLTMQERKVKDNIDIGLTDALIEDEE